MQPRGARDRRGALATLLAACSRRRISAGLYGFYGLRQLPVTTALPRPRGAGATAGVILTSCGWNPGVHMCDKVLDA